MKKELNFINEYFKINDPYSKNPYCILNLPSGKTFTYSMGVRKTTFSKIILDYEYIFIIIEEMEPKYYDNH